MRIKIIQKILAVIVAVSTFMATPGLASASSKKRKNRGHRSSQSKQPNTKNVKLFFCLLYFSYHAAGE